LAGGGAARLGRWRLGRWRLGAGARLWGAVPAGGAVAFVVPPSAVQWAAAAARAIPGRDLQREREDVGGDPMQLFLRRPGRLPTTR